MPKWVSKSTLKFQFEDSIQKCISNLVWPTLHEGQNSSTYHKNRCPCLSLKWVPKFTFKNEFWESWQNFFFSTLVDQPWMRSNTTPNIIKIGVHAYLSNGYLNSHWKPNSEKVDKSAYFQTLFEQPWTWNKIAQDIIEIGVHAYLSNGYLNPVK